MQQQQVPLEVEFHERLVDNLEALYCLDSVSWEAHYCRALRICLSVTQLQRELGHLAYLRRGLQGAVRAHTRACRRVVKKRIWKGAFRTREYLYYKYGTA